MEERGSIQKLMKTKIQIALGYSGKKGKLSNTKSRDILLERAQPSDFENDDLY